MAPSKGHGCFNWSITNTCPNTIVFCIAKNMSSFAPNKADSLKVFFLFPKNTKESRFCIVSRLGKQSEFVLRIRNIKIHGQIQSYVPSTTTAHFIAQIGGQHSIFDGIRRTWSALVIKAKKTYHKVIFYFASAHLSALQNMCAMYLKDSTGK